MARRTPLLPPSESTQVYLLEPAPTLSSMGVHPYASHCAIESHHWQNKKSRPLNQPSNAFVDICPILRPRLSSWSTWLLSIRAKALSLRRLSSSISSLTWRNVFINLSETMAARMSHRVALYIPLLLNLCIISATSRKLTREEQDKINKTRKSVSIFASPLLTCLLTPV